MPLPNKCCRRCRHYIKLYEKCLRRFDATGAGHCGAGGEIVKEEYVCEKYRKKAAENCEVSAGRITRAIDDAMYLRRFWEDRS